MLPRTHILLSLIALFPFSVGNSHAQNFVQVAVGDSHVCGLTEDGMVDCVTAEFATRYDNPVDLPLMNQITAGQQHTCGITFDDDAVCWGGLNFYQEQDVPVIDQPLVDISAGVSHTCAVDISSRAWCWGLNSNEQTEVPGDGYGEDNIGFKKVTGGTNASCGINLNGDISCWSTDQAMTDTSSLSGNFVDLEMSAWTGCGLKDTGDIQCWGNDFNLFDPPNNGPYIDLVVSQTAICALREDQSLDCTFNPDVDDLDTRLFETQSRFLSLDATFIYSSSASNFCGVTTDGQIECLASSRAFGGVPGNEEQQGIDVSTVDIDLSARYYDGGAVELFWTPQPGTRPKILIEVYRNDELLETSDAQFSWYDGFIAGVDSVTYRVRPVDGMGNVGEFSNAVTVDLLSGEISQGNSLAGVEVSGSSDIITTIETYQFSRSSFFAFWQGPEVGTAGVTAYEITVNNVKVALTDQNFYILPRDFPNCQTIVVAALGEDNSILDFRSATVINSAENNNGCRGDG